MITGNILLPEADDDIMTQTFQFGNRPLQFTFIWPRDVYNIYLSIGSYLSQFAANNPVHGLPHNYDPLVYWLTASTYDEFQRLPNQPVKPITAEQWNQIYTELSALATDALYYEEQLVWSITVTDWLGDVYQCVLRPGAWVNNVSVNYRFRFVTERTNIGPDELQFATIEYEVADD